LQDGGVPLWIAGGGEKRTLRIAARYATYTNFDSTTPEVWRRKVQVLRGHCEDIGRDPDEITMSGNFNVVIGETEQDVEDRLARIRDRYVGRVPDAEVEETMHNLRTGPLVGTPDQIVQRLKEAEADGLAYAITYWSEMAYDTSGIELFEREVIPALA
jgi:alkanesulfonate monooxygenase SsuD/methylene tetrahydromethanopterin reductase-like flavin-dependent oxidoreductase (luciferase family)